MTDKYRERIEQLLRKAESTTPEEAEALTAAAEKLMIRHSIDRAMLDLDAQARLKTDEKIVVQKIFITGWQQSAWVGGMTRVALALGLQSMYWANRRVEFGGPAGTLLGVVGFESDVADAVWLIESLMNQSTAALTAFVAREKEAGIWQLMTNHQRHVAKRSFLEAFGTGAAYRIRGERRKVEDEVPGSALAVIDRSKKVAEHYAGLGVKTVKDRRTSDVYADIEGHRAGRNANTNRGIEGAARGAIQS